MQIVGLTGGVASGKSTAAGHFAAAGLPVVDADAIARQVVAPGSPGWRAIAAAFDHVLTPAGELDRAELARRVFSDPQARKELERITHPLIAAEARRRFDRLQAEGHPLALYDVPLLYERSLETLYSPVIVVYVPKDVQTARAMARSGWSRAEAEARIGAQLPLADKRDRADYVLDASGDRESLQRQVEALAQQLRRRFGRP